jgi:FkbM family methyltransferase
MGNVRDEYEDELISSLRWQCFGEGQLEGTELLATDEYRASAFAGGDYDRELFADCETVDMDGSVVFDVGGYMGVSSLLFARMVGKKGRVISFEPNPWNLTRMQRNFSRNYDLGQRIEVHGLALGASRGTAAWTFSDSLDDGHSSTSRLGNAHAAISFAELRQMGFIDDVVRVTTLDAFVDEIGVIPDIVKVDIEGAEHLLLMGGARTLAQHGPTLYVEIHSAFCGLLCSELLRDLGYRMEPLLEESDGRVMIKATKTAGAMQAGDPEGQRESHAAWLALQAVAPRHAAGSPEEENRLLREQLSAANERLNEAQEELAVARLRLPLPELGVRPALRAFGGSCERVVRAAVLSGKKRLHRP